MRGEAAASSSAAGECQATSGEGGHGEWAGAHSHGSEEVKKPQSGQNHRHYFLVITN